MRRLRDEEVLLGFSLLRFVEWIQHVNYQPGGQRSRMA